MTIKKERKGLGRRGFLGMFAGAATAATAVSAVGTASEAHAQESADEKRKARYQDTDHVQAYYRTNRY